MAARKNQKGWSVEAFTPMGILLYEPIHKTKEGAEKHKAELEEKNQGISFGIIEEELRKQRNREVMNE